MFNFALSCFLIFNMLGACMQEIDIITALPFCSSIIIYNDGNQTQYQYETKEYNDILHTFMEMCKDGHEVPALGVSLPEETDKLKQQGLLIEFVFSGEQIYNEMPFEKLLVQVNPEYQGFDIMREYQGQYSGRNFYFRLNNNMQSLYDLLSNITQPKAE